jgi:Ca2+-dependent lipid-binding protein
VFNEVVSFFDKGLFENMLTITVMDSNMTMDETLGEIKMNLNELELAEDGEKEHVVDVTQSNSQNVAGKCYLLFSRKEAPKGAFAGTLHVTVLDINEFSDTAGFMDKADPYVQLMLGQGASFKNGMKTSTKNNAGGHVDFNECFTLRKELFDNVLRVRVMDSDTLSDDTMGELDVNLNELELQPDVDHQATLEMLKPNSQEIAGKCRLTFSRKEAPKGSFSGILHVTVIGIKEFDDNASFMDRADPYVSLQLGAGKPRKTTTKDNAGGNVDFNQTLTFENKGLFDNFLKLRVMDSNTLSDTLLGLFVCVCGYLCTLSCMRACMQTNCLSGVALSALLIHT